MAPAPRKMDITELESQLKQAASEALSWGHNSPGYYSMTVPTVQVPSDMLPQFHRPAVMSLAQLRSQEIFLAQQARQRQQQRR